MSECFSVLNGRAKVFYRSKSLDIAAPGLNPQPNYSGGLNDNAGRLS